MTITTAHRAGKLWSMMKMKMFMVMIKDSNEQIMICWSKLGLGEAYMKKIMIDGDENLSYHFERQMKKMVIDCERIFHT